MAKSIKLHPEYGVNPTIPVCAWCGKEKNEVALLGAAYPGEAPRNLIVDREPCATCAAEMAKGITLIETTDDGKTTGRWAVISEETARRVFSGEGMEAVYEKRAARITAKLAAVMGLFPTAH